MAEASLGGARFYGPAMVVAIGNRAQTGRYGLAQLRTSLQRWAWRSSTLGRKIDGTRQRRADQAEPVAKEFSSRFNRSHIALILTATSTRLARYREPGE